MSSKNLPVLSMPQLHLEVLHKAVPERRDELDQIIAKANVQVVLASDKPGFQLETAFGGIIVGHRTPAASWIVTCGAWDCIAAYSPAILLNENLSSSEISAMPGQHEHVTKALRSLEAARELLQAPDVDIFNWPNGLPRPEMQEITPAEQLVRDIAHIAWAFMLLHEVKHAELRATGDQSSSNPEEERACDTFAISFLLDHVNHYADLNDKTENLVRDIRAMGIMTGLFLIAILGQESDGAHPTPQERFGILFDSVGSQPVNCFWLYAAALLMGALEARGYSYVLNDFVLDREGLAALASNI